MQGIEIVWFTNKTEKQNTLVKFCLEMDITYLAVIQISLKIFQKSRPLHVD